jgi:hypothetical protein
MTDKNTNEQIRARIDAFLDDIKGLVNHAALSAVQDVLSGRTPAKRRRRSAPRVARRGPGRPRSAAAAKRAPRSGGRIRRSSEVVEKMADLLHHYVKAHPGEGIEQISKGLDIASKELKLPVVKLLALRKLRTEGQKRGTRYFVGAKKQTRKPARRAARKAKRVVRRPRKVAKKAVRKSKRVVRRPRKVAKKAVRRRAPPARKAARRPERTVRSVRRKVAQKVIAPEPRPAAAKSILVEETPSIATALAERVAVAG